MILVDDALLADLARKNKMVAGIAAKSGLNRDPDSILGDLFLSGINKQSLLREVSRSLQEKEDRDLL